VRSAPGTLRALRVLLHRRRPPSARRANLAPANTRSRAEAATSAVLAALPRGAKPCLRLCCRAGRAAVDAHARRLGAWNGYGLPGSAAAAARMPMLQELGASAYGDAKVLRLAAGLRALAQGPARLGRARVWVQGTGPAVGGVVSAVAELAGLTSLKLTVCLDGRADGRWVAPPLVLPWATIEVGAGCSSHAGFAARACCA
jgi:hypothetical protein